MNIYNTTNKEIKTTRRAVLRGWRLPDEGLWRTPIKNNVTDDSNLNSKTAIVNKPPSNLLRS